MELSKDDPVYYKCKIRELIAQAKKEGLKVEVEPISRGATVSFVADNGEIASVTFAK